MATAALVLRIRRAGSALDSRTSGVAVATESGAGPYMMLALDRWARMGNASRPLRVLFCSYTVPEADPVTRGTVSACVCCRSARRITLLPWYVTATCPGVPLRSTFGLYFIYSAKKATCGYGAEIQLQIHRKFLSYMFAFGATARPHAYPGRGRPYPPRSPTKTLSQAGFASAKSLCIICSKTPHTPHPRVGG